MIHPVIDDIHLDQVNRPCDFHVGDTVKVHYKIKEGNKERVQVYEGVIMGMRNKGAGRSIIVRRVSFDVGVERIFPVYSPTIEKIEIVRSSKIRQAKLNYLRERLGKNSRLKEVKRPAAKDTLYEKAEVFKKAKAASQPSPVAEQGEAPAETQA